MAKIGHHSVNISIKELSKSLWLEILYKTDVGFYSIIPSDFNEGFDHLSDAEMKEKSLKKLYKSKWSENGEYKRISFATNEQELKNNLDKIIQELAMLVVKRKQVIIISYKNRTDTYSHNRDEELKRIGLDYHLTYCQETKVGDDKVTYNKFCEHEFLGRIETYYSNVTVDREDVVIDDTPENRLQLEAIYKALENLIAKMDSLTKDKESIIEFIESKQKLLS